VAEASEEEEVDEEATAMAAQEDEPDAMFQLEEEPETLLAAPSSYGAIEDHMGGGDGAFGTHQRDLEELAGLLLSSDDEAEAEAGEAAMDVDGKNGGGGGVSQEY
jgi:hypothetical protein